MIVVSDTSPICYLVLIGEIDLLPRLFSQVHVPQAVMSELRHQDAPSDLRRWAARVPSWMLVRETQAGSMEGLERLQRGEQAAIQLAQSINADLILLDEKSGRRVASERGLHVTGTLGVLGEAAARGLLDWLTTIDRLTKTNFRYSPSLLKALLDRSGRL